MGEDRVVGDGVLRTDLTHGKDTVTWDGVGSMEAHQVSTAQHHHRHHSRHTHHSPHAAHQPPTAACRGYQRPVAVTATHTEA